MERDFAKSYADEVIEADLENDLGDEPEVVDHMLTKHYVYIATMHWAVAMLVDFVINFVIGAAIFWWMESVPMWDLPRPCFGMDIVITCAAQAFIKWMVDGTFTRRDMRVGTPCCTLPAVRPAKWCDTPFMNEYCVCVDILRVDGPVADIWEKEGEWKIHMHKILRASRNSIPYVCICWIAFVPTLLAVFTYIFSTGVVITGPQATFIKASYNLVMGCFQTPVVAYLGLTTPVRAPDLHDQFRTEMIVNEIGEVALHDMEDFAKNVELEEDPMTDERD